MTWARRSSQPNPADDSSWLAGMRADEQAQMVVQNGRAARTVACHSADALDCAELLAMLGLEAAEGRRVHTG